MQLKATGGKKGRSDPAKVHNNSDIDRHMQKCKVKKRGKKEQQPELALKVEEKKTKPTNNYQFILLSLKIGAEIAAGITFLLCVTCGFAAAEGPTSSFLSPAYPLNESSA